MDMFYGALIGAALTAALFIFVVNREQHKAVIEVTRLIEINNDLLNQIKRIIRFNNELVEINEKSSRLAEAILEEMKFSGKY